MNKHTCHARGCEKPVPPKYLMCGVHWRMVPNALKARVWSRYRAGQEVTKDPTPAYLEAAQAAVDAVARIEAERRHAALTLPGTMDPWEEATP